jgi:molecular chaperone DnaK (HSP70)
MNINPSDDDAKFQIVATAGDRHLGGDDMDDALAQFILRKQLVDKSDASFLKHTDMSMYASLRYICRKAKEDLCGNDSWKDAREAKLSVTVSWMSVHITITQEEFCEVIRPLIDRACKVIDDALTSWNAGQKIMIDEVVVVGGASKTPSIRKMLATRFPPPYPQELCYSIQGEAVVAQGAAIQAAILSNNVPKYELRNAMMLDALPHAIGVLTQPAGEEEEEEYVTILSKNSPLPAKGSASFHLANARQKGISVTIVEDVGDEYPLQKVCECLFLLHRLTENEIKSKCPNGVREIHIEITANEDGNLIVSYFDDNDPEHIQRRRGFVTEGRYEKVQRSTDEIFLFAACIFFFILYLSVKLAFSNGEQYSSLS